MLDEQVKKVRSYLKMIGLGDEEIDKQLSNKALMDAYLSQVSSYEQNMRNIMASEMLKDENVEVDITDNVPKTK